METGMIGTATTAAAASSGARTTPKNTIDKDGFLQLLVAQLQNQDPTSAGQDPNAMVQQLTSFSSLEQAQQTNSLLQGLQTQTSGLFQAQAAAMVGKNVKVNGSAFNLKGGAANLNVALGAGAEVSITVKDSRGNVVATLPQGRMNKGLNNVVWDGRDANGTMLPDGAYSATVTATGDDGKAVNVQTSLTMKVDAVTFKDGGIYLASGNSLFSLADVLEITV